MAEIDRILRLNLQSPTTMTANRRSFLQHLLVWTSNGVLLVTLSGLTFLAVGALYFMLPLKEICGFSAAFYVIAVLGLHSRVLCASEEDRHRENDGRVGEES